MAQNRVRHTRPSPPTDVKINGQPSEADMGTRSMGTVTISAKIDDPTNNQPVKLKVQISGDDFKTVRTKDTEYGPQARRDSVTFHNLKTKHRFRVRMWTLAKKAGPDQVSKQFTSASFWTNRQPVVELVTPVENAEYDETQQVLFDWKYTDPDSPDDVNQVAYRIKYKTPTSDWKYYPSKSPHVQDGKPGKNTYRLVPEELNANGLNGFVANTTYLWTVQGRDPQGIWSEYPLPVSFFIRGASTPPTLVAPVNRVARVASDTIQFSWKFWDPDPKNTQTQADFRYRVDGTEDVGEGDEGWTLIPGEGTVPGIDMQWDIAPGHFSHGERYEWQVRTYDSKNSGIPSGWSVAGVFTAANAPGSALTDPPLPEETLPLGELGCGHHRAFIYDQPKWDPARRQYVSAMRGEIKPLARVVWNRKRDDIGSAIIDTNGFDQDCCVLLGDLQSWAHELVIFRDGVRVFEGPITRITYTSVSVEVEAKDVMAYLYRRVMEEGYNDTYRRIDLTPKTAPTSGAKGGPYTVLGKNTVVDRALQITLNALAHQDPNVLPYVTAINYPDDATQSRVVYDYSKTAWEEIDDLAANAGLDYTTVGRRIMFWDTHRAIGRLPEMRDGDFSDPVIVTEYGMELSNMYAVTNNSGIAGIAYPTGYNKNNFYTGYNYGRVEMVSSSYSESPGAVVSTESLTVAAKEELVASLAKQARKGIGGRWPTPVVVRVPDNSTINPQVNLGINMLIPGVWIPLRATLTCRKFAQWQKLDSVDVEEIEGRETIKVVMSPAPNGGDDDPDATGAASG